MICVVLCKVLQPIALKTKKLRRKVSQIKAQCSCINDGASLITHNCTINSVENGTRFSYDTIGQKPEKIPYFCPSIHSYFYNDCGCTISTCLKPSYLKIPKISPGAYILQWPFLKGLFLKGLIFGGAYVRRGLFSEFSGIFLIINYYYYY